MQDEDASKSSLLFIQNINKLVTLSWEFCRQCSRLLESIVTTNEYKVLLMDLLYPTMKHFDPDGRGLFQDDSAATHRAR